MANKKKRKADQKAKAKALEAQKAKNKNNKNNDEKEEKDPVAETLEALKEITPPLFNLKGALNIGKTMVENASTIEEYRRKLNFTIKDQKLVGETMKRALDYANVTHFDTANVLEATVKLQKYGFTAKQVLPLVGDMASRMGVDIAKAAEAVAEAQEGNLEGLEDFGITQDVLIAQGEKLKMAALFDKNGKIANQDNFNKVLFSLMEQFKGGTKEQGNTLKGALGTISGVWNGVLAKMAGITANGTIKQGSFFDVLTKKAVQFKELLIKMSGDGTLERICESLGNTTATVLDFITQVIANWPKIGPIVEGIVVAIAGFQLALGALSLYNQMAAIAQGVFNTTLFACPLIWIIAGITGLVVAGYYLIKHWGKVMQFLGGLWDSLKKGWGEIMELFGVKSKAIPTLMDKKGKSATVPKPPKRTASPPGGLENFDEPHRNLKKLPSGNRGITNPRTNNLLNDFSVGAKTNPITLTIHQNFYGPTNKEQVKTANQESMADFERQFNAMMERRQRLKLA